MNTRDVAHLRVAFCKRSHGQIMEKACANVTLAPCAMSGERASLARWFRRGAETTLSQVSPLRPGTNPLTKSANPRRFRQTCETPAHRRASCGLPKRPRRFLWDLVLQYRFAFPQILHDLPH